MCAALILPTFFFFLRFVRTAAATAAGMRSGRIPPRCFRRRFRRGPQCMIMICSIEDAPLVFYSFFLHDRTIKGFPRIFFPFAGSHFPSTFFTNGNGALGLMIPDGFGDPIARFENANRQTGRDTPYLTHTPSSFGGSSSCRPALAFASHSVSTFTTHFGTIEGKPRFLYLL